MANFVVNKQYPIVHCATFMHTKEDKQETKHHPYRLGFG